MKAHISYVMFHICVAEINKFVWKDSRIKPILFDLIKVGALSDLQANNTGYIYDSGFFERGAQQLMAEA